MTNKLNLQEVCFIKIGCKACRKYRDDQYVFYGIKHPNCKDENLSYEEKLDKIKKEYNLK